MAISITNKIAEDSGVISAASYTTTATLAAANNRLYIAVGVLKDGGSVSSVTGAGLSWVKIAEATDGSTIYVCAFRALVTSGATTASITYNFSGSKSRVFCHVHEVTGMNTSGTNGSGAIVQSNTNNTAGATNLAVSLSAFAGSTNAAFGCNAHRTNEVTNPDSAPGAYTELADVAASGTGTESQWRIGSDTSVNATWATSSAAAAVAFEIAIATVTGTVNQATETDTANAVRPQRVKTVAQATETDTANVITAQKARVVAVNMVTETDVANAVAHYKILHLSQATETSTAQVVTPGRGKQIGQATETDEAQMICPSIPGRSVNTLSLAADSASTLALTADTADTLTLDADASDDLTLLPFVPPC